MSLKVNELQAMRERIQASLGKTPAVKKAVATTRKRRRFVDPRQMTIFDFI